ncbi:MAG TPA: hypothetical protein VF328_19010 [Mycobacterium sp.]
MSDIHAGGRHAFCAAFVRPGTPQIRTAKPRGELRHSPLRDLSRHGWAEATVRHRRRLVSTLIAAIAGAAAIRSGGGIWFGGRLREEQPFVRPQTRVSGRFGRSGCFDQVVLKVDSQSLGQTKAEFHVNLRCSRDCRGRRKN